MAEILTIANTKGGSSKSVLTIGLALAYTNPDNFGGGSLKVLIIGADPQRSISDALDVPGNVPSLTDVLDGKVTPREAVYNSSLFGADVIPGDFRLMKHYSTSVQVVTKAILELSPEYDLIITDTAGNFDALTQGALKASVEGGGSVLIPSPLDALSVMGTEFSIETYEGLGVNNMMIVPVMVDGRTRADNEVWLEQLNEISKGRVLKTQIPRNVFASRLGNGEKPSGPRAKDFLKTLDSLAAEVMEVLTNG